MGNILRCCLGNKLFGINLLSFGMTENGFTHVSWLRMLIELPQLRQGALKHLVPCSVIGISLAVWFPWLLVYLNCSCWFPWLLVYFILLTDRVGSEFWSQPAQIGNSTTGIRWDSSPSSPLLSLFLSLSLAFSSSSSPSSSSPLLSLPLSLLSLPLSLLLFSSSSPFSPHPLIYSPSFSSPSHTQHNSHSDRKRPPTWIWICWPANSCQEGARLVNTMQHYNGTV